MRKKLWKPYITGSDCSVFTGYQYNCDETGLFWKATPERSLSAHRIADIKSDKTRITLHFCVNATGNHKLKPWIIGRYQKPACFRAARMDPERLDCIYRWNKMS